MSRNYKKVQSKTNAPLLHCLVSTCNRKYKTSERLQKHVEEKHCFDTMNRNSFKIDIDTSIKIFKLAAEYARVLTEGNRDKMITCAIKLLPQKNSIDNDERKAIITAHEQFSQRIKKAGTCDWEQALKDFEGFLQLGTPYYDTNFCPSLPIDFLWHSLMQDPDLYIHICNRSIGRILPHFDRIKTEQEDIQRYKYFCEVFNHRYGRNVTTFTTDTSNGISASHFDDLVSKYLLKRQQEQQQEQQRIKDKAREYADRVEEERKKKELLMERAREYADRVDEERKKKDLLMERAQKFCNLVSIPFYNMMTYGQIDMYLTRV